MTDSHASWLDALAVMHAGGLDISTLPRSDLERLCLRQQEDINALCWALRGTSYGMLRLKPQAAPAAPRTPKPAVLLVSEEGKL